VGGGAPPPARLTAVAGSADPWMGRVRLADRVGRQNEAPLAWRRRRRRASVGCSPSAPSGAHPDVARFQLEFSSVIGRHCATVDQIPSPSSILCPIQGRTEKKKQHPGKRAVPMARKTQVGDDLGPVAAYNRVPHPNASPAGEAFGHSCAPRPSCRSPAAQNCYRRLGAVRPSPVLSAVLRRPDVYGPRRQCSLGLFKRCCVARLCRAQGKTGDGFGSAD